MGDDQVDLLLRPDVGLALWRRQGTRQLPHLHQQEEGGGEAVEEELGIDYGFEADILFWMFRIQHETPSSIKLEPIKSLQILHLTVCLSFNIKWSLATICATKQYKHK